LQIFDSWAGSLPEDEFERWCIGPTRAIVDRVKAVSSDIPIIGFPKGSGPLAERYAAKTAVDAIGCDTSLPTGWIRSALQTRMPVQGNLDPILLSTGGPMLETRVNWILETFGQGPFIFNLGHGILPDTPIENVEKLVALVKGTPT